MRLTKSTLSKMLALGLLMATAVGCKKEESKPNNNPNDSTNRSTGWTGDSERADTVPKNLNYFGDPKLGNSASLPASVDLTEFLPPVGDQGQFGTCVAWAAAYNMKTALEVIKFGLNSTQKASPQYQLSPKDLFIAIDDNVKGASDCNGTNFTPAMDVLLNRGVATLAVAPYTGLGNCAKANQQSAWNTDAAKHKIARYRRIDATADAIKQELANKIPVVLGAKLADNFMTWGSNDVVYSSHSSFDNVGQHSYHAMLIVGYDNNKGPRGAFKVVNSWSPTWGNAGFIWVDQQFMMNGFMFGGNLYTAANDDQKPDDNPGPNPQPQPNPTGVELIPWVTSDEPLFDEPSNPTKRQMQFDLYNIGTTTAPASTGSGYAYVYYNAYDANDYGVAFFDRQDATAGSTPVCEGATSTSYAGCRFNASIAADNSLGIALFGSGGADGILRTYYMPTNLTGEYYLVMIADVNEKYAEQDENNNLFYVTDQYPIYFEDGIEFGRRDESRQSGYNYAFRNSMGKGIGVARSASAKRFRTAVNPAHPNAYSPQEIIGFLQLEARNGGLQRKVQEYSARVAGKAHGIYPATR